MSSVNYLFILAQHRQLSGMKTKRIKYTENISVVFDKKTKNKIIELATEANISQGEFVRDAVEHYISYLKSKNSDEDKTYEQIAEELIEEFENNFKHLN